LPAAADRDRTLREWLNVRFHVTFGPTEGAQLLTIMNTLESEVDIGGKGIASFSSLSPRLGQVSFGQVLLREARSRTAAVESQRLPGSCSITQRIVTDPQVYSLLFHTLW
jgi:hypothetical protein